MLEDVIETSKLSLNVVLRNWTVYKKDFIANISPTVADPAFVLLSLGVGLAPFVQEIQGMSYAKFLAPGLIATTALFTAFFECSYGFYVRMTFESVFKAMLTTPIGVKEVVLGEFIWVFLKGVVMALGVGIVLACFGLVSTLSLPLVSLVGGLLAIPCGAMGLLASSYVHNINQFQTIYAFLISPIYFLSGVFFPIESPIFAKLVQISPFFHGVRLMQMLAWNRVDMGAIFYHVFILFVFSVVFCTWAYKKIDTKLVS